MNLFGMLELSGSALTAERLRAEVVTSNMANAETTRTAEGGPYRRQLVIFRSERMRQFPGILAGFSAGAGRGVHVAQVIASAALPLRRYQPGHPDADKQGYVSYPDVTRWKKLPICWAQCGLRTECFGGRSGEGDDSDLPRFVALIPMCESR